MFKYFWPLLTLLILLNACSKYDAPPLKIGSNVWPGYELYYLARAIGQLDAKKVRLVEFSSATDVSHQLVNGNIQAGLLTLDEVIRLRQSGLNLKIVQIVDFSRGGDVVMARTPIKEGENVFGKSIACEGSAVGALMLSSFVDFLGIPLDHLNVQYIRVDESEQAFKSGVDFVVTFEPFKTKLMNLGAVQIFDSSLVPNLIVDVFVVREDAITSHSRSQIKHAIDGFFQAKAYMETDAIAASELMAKRLKITPEEAISSYDGISLASIEDNEAMLTGDTPELKNTIKSINEILIENKLISKSVSSEALLLNKPILPESIPL